MRAQICKLGALCALLIAAGCQTTPMTAEQEPPSPPNPAFASEMSKFNAQFPNERATKYENESIAFNNAKKFDEKGGCHGKSLRPVTIILVLDASGRVTNSMTDVDNKKAACFRDAYANVQFPKPPLSPYRKAILLK